MTPYYGNVYLPPPLQSWRKYPVTSVTALLAVLLTLASWMDRDVSLLFIEPDWWPWQTWRLFTSTLLHGDILHLLFNLYWLWIFATVLEQQFGKLKTLAIMLLLAAGSSAGEFAFVSGGIGLSGIGYGLFGLLWVLNCHDPSFPKVINFRLAMLFMGWFFFCIVMTNLQIMRIGNFAHLFGLVLGIFAGLAVVSRGLRRGAMSVVLVAIMVLIFILATIARPYVNISEAAAADVADAGYAALIRGNHEKWFRLYSQAVSMQPDNARYWHILGMALKRLGRTAEAAEAFRKAESLGGVADLDE